MKKLAWPYIVMTIGVAILATGLYFLTQDDHPLRAYGGIGLGAVVVVAGIVSLFLAKPTITTESSDR